MEAKTITTEKLERFVRHMHHMVAELRAHSSPLIHQTISESYYMEKAEELKFLYDQLNEAQKNLEAVQDRISEHYQHIYTTWRKDVRWLHTHLRTRTIL